MHEKDTQRQFDAPKRDNSLESVWNFIVWIIINVLTNMNNQVIFCAGI